METKLLSKEDLGLFGLNVNSPIKTILTLLPFDAEYAQANFEITRLEINEGIAITGPFRGDN